MCLFPQNCIILSHILAKHCKKCPFMKIPYASLNFYMIPRYFLFLKSSFYKSLLNCVLGVLACFACLRACVLSCSACLRVCMLACLACLRAYAPACLARLHAYLLAYLRARVLGVLTCWRACVLTCLVCLCACVLLCACFAYVLPMMRTWPTHVFV